MNPKDTQLNYNNDTRVPCRYGAKCYQTNSQHLNKYKHPPKHTQGNNKEDVPKQGAKRKHSPDMFSSSEEETDNILQFKKVINTPSTSKEIESAQNTTKQDKEQVSVDKGKIENEDVDMNSKEFIKTRFLVEMPPDFYEFWEFCKKLLKNDPAKALKSVGLVLVGPFDVLAGKFEGTKKFKQEEYLRHWRYYYDPPEFQTIIKQVNSGYHMGYFRDDLSSASPDCFVASNDVNSGCIIKGLGDNLFTALKNYLDQRLEKCDPFSKIKVSGLLKTLTTNYAEKIDKFTYLRQREKKIVTKTFHKMGLVVPFNRKTELGYRELAESDATLKKLLDKIDKANCEELLDSALSALQPIITMANIAADECDFGTSVELGIDLFCHGSEALNQAILSLLGSGYMLLNRNELFTVVKAHLEDRKKGTSLSILE